MKKVYRLKELDCANCAAKMEVAIGKIAGVERAGVNFMSQKLTLEAEAVDFPRIEQEAQAIITKIEPHCKMVV